MKPSKAAARRWFETRHGRDVETTQVRPSGITWEPGARTVCIVGSKIRLDESLVQFTGTHVVLEVSDDRVRVEWQDADGITIHTTTYEDADV